MADQVHDLMPEDVAKGIAEGRYLLVDVRELERGCGRSLSGRRRRSAVVSFLTHEDTSGSPGAKQVVFACRSGKRSVTASLAAQAAGLAYDKHLAGGMLAWKAAGLSHRGLCG